jgi:CheY-like chemotaxis protein
MHYDYAGGASQIEIGTAGKLRVLLAMQNREEAELFISELDASGHSVIWMPGYETAAQVLRTTPFDLLITDESLSSYGKREGYRLAEICRNFNELRAGARTIHAIMLVPSFRNWDQIKRARMTGAHVVAKRPGLEQIATYMRVLSNDIATDLALGPILFGIHTFEGAHPEPGCTNCVWQGASLAYGLRTEDFAFERLDTCIVNALLLHRRGLSSEEMIHVVRGEEFLRQLLGSRRLLASAIKMRVARIRNVFTEVLAELGAPFTGKMFLPYVAHGHGRYRLGGNWQLVHVQRKDAA